MNPKILLCPLVSGDYNRSVRAIKSCQEQIYHNLEYGTHVVINSQNLVFIHQIKNFCQYSNIPYSVTESDGTPSTGKNSVFEVFNNSNYTHLSQLDGDDMFYPTFLVQVERHLKKYPTTDVLGTLPLDLIESFPAENSVPLCDGTHGLLWGTHYCSNEDWVTFFGRDPIVDGQSIPHYARFVLYSKKIAEMGFRYDKELVVGEDKKMHFDFLLHHQKDEISYWFTMASDMWVCDRLSFGIQKQHFSKDGFVLDDLDTTKKIREYVESIMSPDRTAPGEIPIDYPPVYLDIPQKTEFLNRFISDTTL